MKALPAPLERLRRLLPGLWLGGLLCVALVATPAAFALLDRPDAGRVVARILGQEAWASLLLGLLLLLAERQRIRLAAGRLPALGVDVLLPLGTVFCTLAGYFAVQAVLPAVRAGQGGLSFGQWHAVSVTCFGLKGLLVAAMAWRAAAPAAALSRLPSS